MTTDLFTHPVFPGPYTTVEELTTITVHRVRKYTTTKPDVRSWALFSLDKAHRYALGWQWNPSADNLVMIGLNPSTATHERTDPTVARCITRAKTLGFGGLWMLNLFAYRQTDPTLMKLSPDPVGAANDASLSLHCTHGLAGLVVAAWDTDGAFRNRGAHVRTILESKGVQLHVLQLTKGGHPQHPLYLPYSIRPIPWPA